MKAVNDNYFLLFRQSKMTNRSRTMKNAATSLLILSLFALLHLECASVPKEVVQLSYTMGQDLVSVESSYRSLIHTHFDDLRKDVDNFIDNEWTNAFLQDFIVRTNLDSLVKQPDPKQVLSDLQEWTAAVIQQVSAKKKGLKDPIDQHEALLLQDVDESFGRIIQANSVITNHLNSLTKIDSVQSETLRAMGLGTLRDRVNNALIQVSDEAASGIDKARSLEKDL